MQRGGGGGRRGSEGVGTGGIRGHLSCFWHAAWVSNRCRQVELIGLRGPAKADGRSGMGLGRGGGQRRVTPVLSMTHVRDVLTAKTDLYVLVSHWGS